MRKVSFFDGKQPLFMDLFEETTTALESKLTLARYLGRVDPWYDCNINSLGAMMLKLANMVISYIQFFQDLCR